MSRISITLVYFIIIVGIPGGYAVFRYAQTPAVIDFTVPSTFAHVAPTVCDYTWSDFGSSGVGRLYAAGGKVRVEHFDTRRGDQVAFHFIVDSSSQTVYEWDDDGPDVETLTVGELQAARDRYSDPEETLPPMKCKPWWIPKERLFTAPLEV